MKCSLGKERDLFRLACNACWEILECAEWGTVVLLQLSDCIEQQVSCNETQHVSGDFSLSDFHVQMKLQRIQANVIRTSAFHNTQHTHTAAHKTNVLWGFPFCNVSVGLLCVFMTLY